MRETIEPQRVYNLQEARKVLDLSDATFRLLMKRGEIKGKKLGRQWRFLGSDLLNVLKRKDAETG